MRQFKFLLTVLIPISLVAISCDSVLEAEVISGVTAEDHYQTPEGFQDAVNASYIELRSYYGQELGSNLTEMGTDLVTNGGHGGFHYMNLYSSSLNSESSPFWDLWSHFYQAINTTNAVVDRADRVEGLRQDEINSKVAEARFLRAHYYFILMQHFGDIHLTLEETVGVEVGAERTSQSEVYAAIIDDLEYGIDHLPIDPPAGRASEPAAKHMLSLVYLTRAQSENAEDGDLDEAVALADEVIEGYDFRLLDRFADVFDFDNQRNDEIIWSVQYTQDPLLNASPPGRWQSGNNAHLHWTGRYYMVNDGITRALEYGRPWQRHRPTTFAMENFRPLDEDTRYHDTFQTVWQYNEEETLPEGASLGDTAYVFVDYPIDEEYQEQRQETSPGVQIRTWNPENREREDELHLGLYGQHKSALYWHINLYPTLEKQRDQHRDDMNAIDGSRDYFVYRLAETYMNAAEAELLRGNTNAAADYVNVVRRRAAAPGFEADREVTAGDIDMDFLLDERGREFYGEQKRWLDLKRTGKLLERVREYNESEASDNIQDFHTLRPIPTNQRDRVDGEYPQNPEY